MRLLFAIWNLASESTFGYKILCSTHSFEGDLVILIWCSTVLIIMVAVSIYGDWAVRGPSCLFRAQVLSLVTFLRQSTSLKADQVVWFCAQALSLVTFLRKSKHNKKWTKLFGFVPKLYLFLEKVRYFLKTGSICLVFVQRLIFGDNFF